MASLEQIIRTNENAYRVPDKMQKSKGGRKPLGDVTNSSKPLRNKSLNGFKVARKVRTPTKAVRKPLRDLSNSNNRLNENLSAVSENPEVENWGFCEGFGHNHNKCIEAQRQSMSMSMDYFLETAGLKKDSSLSEFPKLSTETKSEFEIGELEMMDGFLPTPPPIAEMIVEFPVSPPTPKSANSPCSESGPCWELEWLDKFEIEVMESPPRN